MLSATNPALVISGSGDYEQMVVLPKMLERALGYKIWPDIFTLPKAHDWAQNPANPLTRYTIPAVMLLASEHSASEIIQIPANSSSNTPEKRAQVKEVCEMFDRILQRQSRILYIWREQDGDPTEVFCKLSSTKSRDKDCEITQFKVNPPKIKIGMIGCSDFGMADIRNRAVKELLGENGYCFHGIPGGPLSYVTDCECGESLQRLSFESFVKEGVQKIVIKTHERCRAYQKLEGYEIDYQFAHSQQLYRRALNYNPDWEGRISIWHLMRDGSILDWTYKKA